MSDLHIYYGPEPRGRLWCTWVAAPLVVVAVTGLVYAIGWMP